MGQRIITGVVGIAFAAFVIQSGGILFALFALLLAILGWGEFVRAFAKKGMYASFYVGAMGIFLFALSAWCGNYGALVASTMGMTLLLLLQTVFRHGKFTMMDAVLSISGMLYFGYPFAHLAMLRFLGGERSLIASVGNVSMEFSVGCALVWVMFLGTWASDTFAYFVGSAVGRRKLCPSISPNKTVEGFFGSFVGTTATVAGLGALLSLPLLPMAVLGGCLSVLATLGDLVESVGKRYTGIKDSGTLIPGHGGVWDRFDSALYTAPFAYYYAQYVLLPAM